MARPSLLPSSAEAVQTQRSSIEISPRILEPSTRGGVTSGPSILCKVGCVALEDRGYCSNTLPLKILALVQLLYDILIYIKNLF